jgi:hypothetical protein
MIKYQLMKQDRNDESRVFEIGKFQREGDAMWAGMIFSCHVIFSQSWIFWVQRGKAIYPLPGAMNRDNFHFYDQKNP